MCIVDNFVKTRVLNMKNPHVRVLYVFLMYEKWKYCGKIRMYVYNTTIKRQCVILFIIKIKNEDKIGPPVNLIKLIRILNFFKKRNYNNNSKLIN